MKRYLARYIVGFVIMLMMMGHATRLQPLEMVSRLDAILYDMRLRMTMPETRDEQVVILDIDEKSLAEIGRWPWSRNRLAALLDRLFDHYGIRVLGFDVVFAEPDDSSGLKSLKTLAQQDLKDDEAHEKLQE